VSRVRGFPPISAADAEVLILGSMPGRASLDAQQYYAHPRNAFWPIMAMSCGFDPAAGYAQRCASLVARRIAVWDVLQSCSRQGSLDAAIDASSVRVNDFGAFFAAHPGVRRVLFNGATAERLYRRHVLPRLPPASAALACVRLPSTSPAHAAMTHAQKTARWGAELG
jgi:TDG/mug DNA glycosylase family protein